MGFEFGKTGGGVVFFFFFFFIFCGWFYVFFLFWVFVVMVLLMMCGVVFGLIRRGLAFFFFLFCFFVLCLCLWLFFFQCNGIFTTSVKQSPNVVILSIWYRLKDCSGRRYC